MNAKRQQSEQLIRTYFAGCNQGDFDKIVSCLTANAIHYFPAGMYGGPWRGATTIAASWCSMVERMGSSWALERVVISADADQAVAEWTHYKGMKGQILRGDEWYTFDAASGLIAEIRAYYASPQATGMSCLQLEGFDYASNGYSLEPQVSRVAIE